MAKIIYSFFGVGSGTLGANAFNNAAFIISIPTDTSRINANANLYPQPVLRVSSTTNTDTISLIDLNLSAVFNVGLNITLLTDTLFIGLDVDRLFGVTSPALPGYSFKISTGMVSGAPSLVARNYPTTAGDLVFNSVSSAAFQATLLPA